MLSELNDRYKEILRIAIDAYLVSGEPASSRFIADNLSESLSSATIRNVMADLEALGLLYAPHISAGRLPTETGLRLFVDGLMEVQELKKGDISLIEGLAGSGQLSAAHQEGELYDQVGHMLSSLSNCAAVVAAPKRDRTLRQIEFVQLAPGRVLIVLVSEDGMVENRIMDVPLDLPASSLTMASNYLNNRILGKHLHHVHDEVLADVEQRQNELDKATASLVKQGLAESAEGSDQGGLFVVRGQGNLLDSAIIQDLDHVRQLFDALENQKTLLKILDALGDAEGMQVFIGSENKAFGHAGLSLVVAPYKDRTEQIVGAIGVIGPTRLNYGRIVPIVDYTSQILSRLIG